MQGGDSKKAKFHYETAAMLGDEVARYSTGAMELMAGNMEQAIKHYKILQHHLDIFMPCMN
jgi:outer membrane protein assembly factor BamD (BamD/ComL family)